MRWEGSGAAGVVEMQNTDYTDLTGWPQILNWLAMLICGFFWESLGEMPVAAGEGFAAARHGEDHLFAEWGEFGHEGEEEIAAESFDEAFGLEEGGEGAGDDAVGAEVVGALVGVVEAGGGESFVEGERAGEEVAVDEGEVDALAEVGAHGVGGVAEEERVLVVGCGHVNVAVVDELGGPEGGEGARISLLRGRG